ncbi:ATP-dependent (S)-NAD(P)H-hydrate dehydratase isoform X2 [Folsomia candida]|uniref:ATP-dependent (S)-NAD(P)H-hydrate dehydratase isoform X2 n=1 Tax=Folsomia candida TaxID=158441 RepID=UPI001604E34E|nr:ATP-dependent (S)-NAD(P)H-hydrate dehydratase isoform X2 [Folsomia candida]
MSSSAAKIYNKSRSIIANINRFLLLQPNPFSLWNSSTTPTPTASPLPLLSTLASLNVNKSTTTTASNTAPSSSGTSAPSGSRTMASTPVGNDEALLASARAFIPSLTNAMHKGQAGRIMVIGGNEEYTGAPYFSGISALKVGADLAHIVCVKNASPVIKSYSPELIVHPILDSDNAVEQIMNWVPRMHCIVIGPGMGRDPKILNVVAQVIEKLKELDKPMIIDADGLFLVTSNVELIRNYSKVILTPNSMEFSRLISAVLGEEVKPAPSASAEKVKELAKELGYVTILHKGATDVASNGRLVVCCAGGGSNRRCGGQGDLLAGALSVLFHWAIAFGDRGDAPAPPELLAAYGACRLTRECARLAYSQNGRSTTTSDLVRLIHQAFSFLFGP